MSRKKRVVLEADGTPVETDELLPDSGPEVPTSNEVPVYWTKAGAERGVFSEHGSHREGERVLTAYAQQLIDVGAATLEPPETDGEGQ